MTRIEQVKEALYFLRMGWDSIYPIRCYLNPAQLEKLFVVSQAVDKLLADLLDERYQIEKGEKQ